MQYFYQKLVISKTHLIFNIVHLYAVQHCIGQYAFLALFYMCIMYTQIKKYHLQIIFGMWKTQNVNILFGSSFKQVNK